MTETEENEKDLGNETPATDVNAVEAQGQKWPEYVCRYYHDGTWWGLNITARDQADAEARVAKLGSLQLEGKLMMTIPANRPLAGWIAMTVCAIRNRLWRSM